MIYTVDPFHVMNYINHYHDIDNYIVIIDITIILHIASSFTIEATTSQPCKVVNIRHKVPQPCYNLIGIATFQSSYR